MIVTIVFFVVSALFSCKGQPDDIKLNDQFVAFAELSETNDTLWGVKDSDGQVVKPGRYRDFALEGHVITCVGKDDSLKYAFTSEPTEKVALFEVGLHRLTLHVGCYN